MGLRIYALIATFPIGLVPSLSPADAGVADASIRCSGLYYVLTSLPNNPTAKDLGVVMGNVFKIHQSDATGRKLSNRDMLRARDNAAVELGSLYAKAPAEVVELYLQCNRWSRQVASYLDDSGVFTASNTVNEGEINQIVLAAPRFPEPVTVPGDNRQEGEQAIAQAFELWTDNKRVARQSALDMLRNELETQKEAGDEN